MLHVGLTTNRHQPLEPREGRLRTAVVSVLMLVPITIAACSDSTGVSTTSSKADSHSLAGVLRSVPNTAEIRGWPVFYGNLSRVRAGEHPSSSKADVLLLMDRSASSIFLPSVVKTTVNNPDFARFAGFDTRAIDAAFEFGGLPESVAGFVGTMRGSDIEKGLAASPGGDQLSKESKNGVEYLALGDDGKTDFKSISAIRTRGEPLRMALAGDTVYRSTVRTAIDAALAASGGGAKSLGDDSNYLAVAQALDTADVVNAIVVSPAAGENWLVAGLGETFKGEASTLTIALRYADAAIATSAATAFRTHVEDDDSLVFKTPWAQTLTVTDAHADGSVMVATLTSKKPGISENIVLAQDNLLQF
jgi:hypothetical protein